MSSAAPASYVLAIDTSLGATACCLLSPGAPEPLARESMTMERGHADALIPMIDRVVSRAPDGFASVARVAVTVGPGSFTGIRIGVAAARAIGLACGVPVVGVSTLSVLAAPSIAAGVRGRIVVAIDARHGNVYVQRFGADGGTEMAAAALPVPAAVRALGPGPVRLVGSGASMMAIEAWSMGLDVEVDEAGLMPDIAFVARLGGFADPARARPTPFYLKPPDARPPVDGLIPRVP